MKEIKVNIKVPEKKDVKETVNKIANKSRIIIGKGLFTIAVLADKASRKVSK